MVHLLPDKVLDVSCGIKPALYLPNMPPDVVSNKLPVTDLYSFVWGAIPDSRLDKKAFFDGLNPAESITFRQCRDDSKAFARGLRDKSTPWGGVKRHEWVYSSRQKISFLTLSRLIHSGVSRRRLSHIIMLDSFGLSRALVDGLDSFAFLASTRSNCPRSFTEFSPLVAV